MQAVNRRIFTLILTGVVSLFSTASHSDEKEDATAAAKAVMAAFAEKKFDLIWDTLASDRYKLSGTKELFIAAFTHERRQIGRLTSSTVLDVISIAPQPNAGFQGKTYTVTFQNVYTTGTLIEYVVLFEENGQLKMAGFSK
jgi:hypothetical protein